MRQLPSSLAPAGCSPARLNPLSPAPVNNQGQRLTDLMAMQRLFANGEQGGYWPADPEYLFEDSAGTIPASVNGVVGLWLDVSQELRTVELIINGNHAVQATTVNKPDLRKTPVSNKVWLNSNVATGALTVTFSGSLGSACTVATVGAEGVTIADNQTVGTTYNLCPPYGYNGGVLIINRALTTAEKALVTRVMGWNVPTLGSELISNGEFENWSAGAPVGWTLSSQNANNYVVEVSPGRARLVCDNAIAVYVQKSMPLGIKYYFTTATITELISGSAKITLVNGSAEKVFSSTGVISMVGKTTATDYFQVRRNVACNVVVDRVSVKEIL